MDNTQLYMEIIPRLDKIIKLLEETEIVEEDVADDSPKTIKVTRREE